MEWKFVDNTKDYMVSDTGLVKSLKYDNERILKHSINPKGYAIVNLMIDGRRYGKSIHSLVALAFIKNDCPKIKNEVNHKDGNKLNNFDWNLEWCTTSQNMKHRFDILGINSNVGKRKTVVGINIINKDKIKFESLISAGEWCNKKFNTNYGKMGVYKAIKRYRKTYHGYIWDYN